MDPDQRSVIGDHQPGRHSEPAPENGARWRRGLNQQDVDRLNRATEDHSAIVEEIPLDKASLGAFSVLGLVFNRMTGSGIFNSSSVIFYNTQSIGVSLLIWLYGMVMAISGLVLYIELGLTVPRWKLPNGLEISTPRSGAELVYVSSPLGLGQYAVLGWRTKLIFSTVQLLPQSSKVPRHVLVRHLLSCVRKHGDQLGCICRSSAPGRQGDYNRRQGCGHRHRCQHLLVLAAQHVSKMGHLVEQPPGRIEAVDAGSDGHHRLRISRHERLQRQLQHGNVFFDYTHDADERVPVCRGPGLCHIPFRRLSPSQLCERYPQLQTSLGWSG